MKESGLPDHKEKVNLGLPFLISAPGMGAC